MAVDPDRVSKLLELLPAVFQEDRVAGTDVERLGPNFLGRFLLGFEKILLGLDDPDEPGIDEVVANLHRYFEPGAGNAPAQEPSVPAEFLSWLAGWLALVLREDLDDDPVRRESRQRELIASASELYRRRGTKKGVADFIAKYSLIGPDIEEFGTPLQVGVHSTVGVDTLLGGGTPFFFRVTARIAPRAPSPGPAEDFATRAKKAATVIRAIVDQQKPAHTHYELRVVPSSGLCVGVQCTVGVDTILAAPELTK